MPFIMLTVLIDMVSIGLIVPVLPPLVGSFTSSPAEQAVWYGAVTFAFGIANFFASPMLGALSDRYGRRPVLLLGFSGLALSFFVTGRGHRVVDADRGAPVQRRDAVQRRGGQCLRGRHHGTGRPGARRFGMLGAMFGVGFILGPVMGGLLGGIDLRLPFFVAGGLALLNLLYGLFVLPESLPPERRRPSCCATANPVASLRGLAELKGVGPLVVVVA